MWVADLISVKIFAYDMTTKQHDSSKDFDTLAAAGHDYPWGIWSDGATFWVSNTQHNAIYAYNGVGTTEIPIIAEGQPLLPIPPNRAPVSDAGDDQTVNVNQSVTLNGTGSSDPDGNTISYSWSQTSGGTVTLSNAATSSPTFTAPASPATLVFRLNVTDGTLHSSDTVTVTVQDDSTTVAITHVDGGSGFVSYTDGMTVNTDTPRFRGTSSGYDSITLQVRYSNGTLTQIGTGTGVNDDGSFQRGRTTLPDGTYTILVGTVSLGTITVATADGATTVPARPQNLQVASVTNTTVTLTWDLPDDSTITGYKIMARNPVLQDQFSVLVEDTGSAGNSYTIQNLEPNTNFVFRIIAVNEIGESVSSKPAGTRTAS